MARPFVTEIPSQDAWAVIRDALDGKIDDWDLALRTINDVMSFASGAFIANNFKGSGLKQTAEDAKGQIGVAASGGVATFDWRAILDLLLQWFRDLFNK